MAVAHLPAQCPHRGVSSHDTLVKGSNLRPWRPRDDLLRGEVKKRATLTARTARMIFALVAAFDLDPRQGDAVSALLISKLSKEIYSQVPEGFENQRSA